MDGNIYQHALDYDTVIEEGELVYSIAWDSGGPGAGADAECVFRLGSRYAVVLSFEDDPSGPYFTLVDAVKATELDWVTDATTEVTSTKLSAAEIAAMLRCEEAPSFSIHINAENWRLDQDGKFRRAE